MKRSTLVVAHILLAAAAFAQETPVEQNQRTVQDTVVTKISITADTTKIDTVASTAVLPTLLRPATPNNKPKIEKITAEVKNDTVTPVVRIKVVTTEELMAKERQMHELESAPVKDKITATDTKKSESFADPGDTAVVKDRTYKIQVIALQKENQKYLEKLKETVGSKHTASVENDNGMYKYMVGTFETYYDAVTFRDELVKEGYRGAFVVVYFKDQRVSRQEKGFVKVKK